MNTSQLRKKLTPLLIDSLQKNRTICEASAEETAPDVKTPVKPLQDKTIFETSIEQTTPDEKTPVEHLLTEEIPVEETTIIPSPIEAVIDATMTKSEPPTQDKKPRVLTKMWEGLSRLWRRNKKSSTTPEPKLTPEKLPPTEPQTEVGVIPEETNPLSHQGIDVEDVPKKPILIEPPVKNKTRSHQKRLTPLITKAL